MNDHIAGGDLAAYVDGTLAEGKKAELESHFSSCPDCLAELAEIVSIQGSREKIPGEFLRRALGQEQAARKTVLPLRLVFEIAAAFLVVVLIGYFFLGGNRSWQEENTQKEKTAATSEKPLPRSLPEVGKTMPQFSAQAKPAETAGADKKTVAGGTMISAAPAKLVEKKTEQPAVRKDRRSAAQDEKGIGKAELKLAETAAPAIRDEMEKTVIAEPVRSLAAETTAAAGAVRPESAFKSQAAPPAGKGMADAAPGPRLLIEGEVGRADLRDPGQLDGWSWFRKGLILELAIDQAGIVTAVTPVGPWDRSTAVGAEKAARLLAFSVSDKKSRRARIFVSASSPN